MWLEEAVTKAVEDCSVGAAVVVSHDRQFLQRSCTHTVDVASGKADFYAGGYLEFMARRRRREEVIVRDA